MEDKKLKLTSEAGEQRKTKSKDRLVLVGGFNNTKGEVKRGWQGIYQDGKFYVAVDFNITIEITPNGSDWYSIKDGMVKFKPAINGDIAFLEVYDVVEGVVKEEKGYPFETSIGQVWVDEAIYNKWLNSTRMLT